MSLSPELEALIPSSCLNCPVLKRLEFVEGHYGEIAKESETKAIGQTEDPLYAHPVGEELLGEVVKAYGGMSVSMSELQMRWQKNKERVLSEMDEACPGSTRGNQATLNPAARALGYLIGQRTCHNPNFRKFKNDPDIKPQLKLGRWQETTGN